MRGYRARHASEVGVVLRSHYQTAFLPGEIAEIFFRRTAAVDAGGVDFVVPVGLEDIEEGGGCGEGVDACLLDAWGCQLEWLDLE